MAPPHPPPTPTRRNWRLQHLAEQTGPEPSTTCEVVTGATPVASLATDLQNHPRWLAFLATRHGARIERLPQGGITTCPPQGREPHS